MELRALSFRASRERSPFSFSVKEKGAKRTLQ